MIRRPAEVAELERRYARERLGAMSYGDALRVFEALWRYARSLGVGPPEAWEEDLAPDLEVARAINGLPPGP